VALNLESISCVWFCQWRWLSVCVPRNFISYVIYIYIFFKSVFGFFYTWNQLISVKPWLHKRQKMSQHMLKIIVISFRNNDTGISSKKYWFRNGFNLQWKVIVIKCSGHATDLCCTPHFVLSQLVRYLW
jgi:hypothetical protein